MFDCFHKPDIYCSVSGNCDRGGLFMDYKKEIIEMIEKADHDQLYTIFRFIISFLGLK